nr:uncharacterized protein LOC109167286 [Ipomoea batatas]
MQGCPNELKCLQAIFEFKNMESKVKFHILSDSPIFKLPIAPGLNSDAFLSFICVVACVNNEFNMVMVEHMHQSCASLVNASASLNVIAEISAELQREKQKNAELMERIMVLEAQLQERQKASCENGRWETRKFKRQKVMTDCKQDEDGSIKMNLLESHKRECRQTEEKNLEDRLVKWMSTDETQFLHSDKPQSRDFVLDSNDRDGTDDQEDGEHREEETGNTRSGEEINLQFPSLDRNQELNEDVKEMSSHSDTSQMRFEENCRKEMAVEGYCETASVQRSHQKMAFCPKEVKRILEMEGLSKKNAQSHTIRKIIVFSSLGIRHGCEDMYELDLNHFSILQKGESYVDQKNPGEHVLYQNPGVRRKIFYPNRQNPTLCPVQILEEEKVMRPSDASCPSCLFLCIKYGGRTRNLPQNEYVRQRMGRNKLKSFGPVICRMAMLVHVRCGSFFFKALGITLLFMAGFPNDLVQRETNYKNLDLLQKYYRTDKDAEGEELFLSYPLADQQTIQVAASSKQKSKKHTTTSGNLDEKTSAVKSPPPHSDQFELTGYASNLTNATFSPKLTSSQVPTDVQPLSNPMITSPNTNTLTQSSYPFLPAYPTNSFVPMVYWHPANPFQLYPYPSGYRYPPPGNYLSIHPHQYYSHPPSNPPIPKLPGNGRNHTAPEIAEKDSNSSSSSKESRKKMS